MALLRNLFKYGLPIVLSAWLCYYLYTKVDIEAMKEEISKCNYIWIGIALVISIFSHIFRAMRWSIQLNALNIRTPLNPSRVEYIRHLRHKPDISAVLANCGARSTSQKDKTRNSPP